MGFVVDFHHWRQYNYLYFLSIKDVFCFQRCVYATTHAWLIKPTICPPLRTLQASFGLTFDPIYLANFTSFLCWKKRFHLKKKVFFFSLAFFYGFITNVRVHYLNVRKIANCPPNLILFLLPYKKLWEQRDLYLTEEDWRNSLYWKV